jgi:tripartite-type tricarboxylate transporter receptor subunit TctC
MRGATNAIAAVRGMLCVLALLAAFAIQGGLVSASEWPTRTITLIAPFAAGGNLDIAARIFARELSKRLNTDVIVENKGGANGAIGMAFVAKANPDGYTLILTGSGPVVFNKMLLKSMAYDPDTEFTPIVLTTELLHVLATNPKLPINNLKELIEYANSKGGV